MTSKEHTENYMHIEHPLYYQTADRPGAMSHELLSQ